MENLDMVNRVSPLQDLTMENLEMVNRVSPLQDLTMENLDMVNRDPNNINDHIKVLFEDILAEPEGAHSVDCVWKASHMCFNCCKNCYYTVFTCLFGICIAMYWGVEFAQLAICHIWFVTPYFKICELQCGCCRKFYGQCVHCLFDPCCEACALLFGAFEKG